MSTTPIVETDLSLKVDTEMQDVSKEFMELEILVQELTVSLLAVGKRLKKLEKMTGSLVKSRSKKVKTHKKEVPVPVSEKLVGFMALAEPLTTRSDALRKISDYVRTTGLQLQDDKRTFVTDKVLADLFSIAVGEKLTFLAINKYVTPLFLTEPKPVVKDPVVKTDKKEVVVAPEVPVVASKPPKSVDTPKKVSAKKVVAK